MASIPAFTLTTRKPALMRSPKCLMDAKHVGQDYASILKVTQAPKCLVEARWTGLRFYFEGYPSTQVLGGSTLDSKMARGFSCLISVMTLWKDMLVRRPPVTTRPEISVWPYFYFFDGGREDATGASVT